MHFDHLSPVELRVLGCLIEKRWTTPDGYPLSLNSLRLACNQSTNRDPVTAYDEATVKEAAQRLTRYGLARLASGHSSRAVKFRHLAEEALGLGREELALLAVLMLRGAQTPGELKARSERMAPVGSLAQVEERLEGLCARGYARRLSRRPGQKEDRFVQLLGGGGGEPDRVSAMTSSPDASLPPGAGRTVPYSTGVDPRGEDLKRFLAEDPGGPVVMLNLLKLREGGRSGYERYGQEIVPFLDELGAQLIYAGDASTILVAPEQHDWDIVLLVRYPSREAFSRMVLNPEYQKITGLRTEALQSAVLQATVPWWSGRASA